MALCDKKTFSNIFLVAANASLKYVKNSKAYGINKSFEYMEQEPTEKGLEFVDLS